MQDLEHHFWFSAHRQIDLIGPLRGQFVSLPDEKYSWQLWTCYLFLCALDKFSPSIKTLVQKFNFIIKNTPNIISNIGGVYKTYLKLVLLVVFFFAPTVVLRAFGFAVVPVLNVLLFPNVVVFGLFAFPVATVLFAFEFPVVVVLDVL